MLCIVGLGATVGSLRLPGGPTALHHQNQKDDWRQTLPDLSFDHLREKYGKHSETSLNRTNEQLLLLQALRGSLGSLEEVDAIVNSTEHHFRQTLEQYYRRYPELLETPPQTGNSSNAAFLEVSSATSTKSMEGSCEVCVYVIENKQMRQPFLCRGLKSAQYVIIIAVCCESASLHLSA